MKVAILGASGIGKNHARWFHKHGCDVSAFLGSSAATTASTIDGLQAQFPFEGIGYTDLSVLLREEQPDAVCVATPPALHFTQVLDSLDAGVHVLCEKPLIYAPSRPARENIDGAKELLKIAKKKKLILGMQLQYAGATPTLCRLVGVIPAEISDFAMELETTNPNSPRNGRDLWADLGSHALSVAQVLAGEGAKLDEETIQFTAHETADSTEVIVRWRLNCVDGRLLTARFIGRRFDPQVHRREPRRRFAFNGRVIYYSGLQTKAGNYISQYMTPDGYTTHFDDPVDYVIRNFVRACNGVEPVIFSGEMGVQNLEWLLKITDHAPEPTYVEPESAPTPSIESEPELVLETPVAAAVGSGMALESFDLPVEPASTDSTPTPEPTAPQIGSGMRLEGFDEPTPEPASPAVPAPVPTTGSGMRLEGFDDPTPEPEAVPTPTAPQIGSGMRLEGFDDIEATPAESDLIEPTPTVGSGMKLEGFDELTTHTTGTTGSGMTLEGFDEPAKPTTGSGMRLEGFDDPVPEPQVAPSTGSGMRLEGFDDPAPETEEDKKASEEKKPADTLEPLDPASMFRLT